MEKRDTIRSVHDLQDSSHDACSCGKTTSSDQKSSSTVYTNSTTSQPSNTSLRTPSVIESASATTSSKNHTDSAPLIIFAVSMVILFFMHPMLSNLAHNAITHVRQWAEMSSPTEKKHSRRYRYAPYQDEKRVPEELLLTIPLSPRGDSHE